MSMVGKTSILFMAFFSAVFTVENVQAQMWGSGMYPAMQACPYNPMMSEEVRGVKADQDDIKDQLKDIKSELRHARTRAKSADKALSDIKSRFQKNGLQGSAYTLIDNHISSGRSCDQYATADCPAKKKGRRLQGFDQTSLDPIDELLALNGFEATEATRNIASGNAAPGKIEGEDGPPEQPRAPLPAPPAPQPPPRSDAREPQQPVPPQQNYQPPGQGFVADDSYCEDKALPTKPFRESVWEQACSGSALNGGYLCRQGVSQGAQFNDRLCERLFTDWVSKKREADEAHNKVSELEAELARLDIEKADKNREYRDAVKEAREEYRRSLTEGGCVECMMSAQGGYQMQQRRPNWLEVGGNLLLGLGSMYFGQQQQRYISDNNAKLGFPTQSYPSFGFGFPYFSNALYGALGGGMSSGSFGCGSGMGVNGGAFGYPNGMMGNPMGAGMFNGGFGPGALGYGMNGSMMPGYMMSGGMMMPGAMMNGMYGNMMPGAMMPGYGYMMAGNVGMMANGMPGMMMPGAYMMNGSMMMPGYMSSGMMLPGYMANGMAMMPGSMANMMPGSMMPGYMMSGMIPGSMMSMMPGAMTGGMTGMGVDPMAMQMQQMQTQMAMQQQQQQMQQYQVMMQMQQRRMENYMAQSRVVTGLTMEMQSLSMRLQQAQMSMATGGTSGFEMGFSSPYMGAGGMPFSTPSMYMQGTIAPGVPGTIGPAGVGPTLR